MPRRRSGLRVLKAVSSSMRLKVLNLLLNRGPLSYTEIMKILRLNPTRDAGRFAYHLKFLLETDLIEPDTEAKKYRLTDLGRTIIDVTEDIEKRFFKRKKIFVRTSRLAMEEFNRSRIIDSLVREANIPTDLAQKIARETEGRLSEFKTKYLTAPLIREFVNTILVEKGLEEYRHKLTRLGLPVYDVTQLILSKGAAPLGVEAVHNAAGDAVLEEYTLLNVLPRDIADAHLSGRLHLNNLGWWILKPNEFMHDLRFFFQHGMDLGRTSLTGVSSPPPRSLESALSAASSVLKIASTETSGEQAFDYFNVFLAPFAQGLSEERIRESLRTFAINLSQSSSDEGSSTRASLGLELVVPSFLEKKRAIGVGGKKTDRYGDFVEESRLIASLLLEVMFEDSRHKPIFNPSLIMKMRPEVFKNKECSSVLFQSHRLAAERGLPYFANLRSKDERYASYTSTGCRFSADWKGDWELDTLQTGSVDSAVLNLPRASYDAEGSRSVFFRLLDERLEMAWRALEIKYRTLRQRAREGLLPFLTQKADGNCYSRLENATRLISFVGLNETVESFLGKAIPNSSEAMDFAKEIVEYLSECTQSYAKKPETRTALSMVPSTDTAKRLAELDVEHCGWEKVHVQGTREQPFYTDMVTVPLTTEVSWKRRLSIEEEFHKLAPGSHLAVIQLTDSKQEPERLLSATREIVSKYEVGLYAYSRNLAYCSSCQKTFYGIPPKCPSCGSVNMLICFSRISAKYLPAPFWNPAQILALDNRVSYVLIST
ncbi:MAG: helix-turn-helix domain-containing protein [Candidatus Bathyarchaeota archaeon]|nr:MAG: helix-turn-helix domain-containing protein [Candidatus Bathyarchaeota archaeon]